MLINGVELEDIDVFDADIAERYENALEKVVEDNKNVDGIKVSIIIRQQCNAVFKLFNTMFGEGTDKKVFGDKVNIVTCLKAFEELVEQVNIQKQEVEKMASKYSPNRAARRNNK